MKKFLFVGDTNGNTGPANVNKGIVANLSDAFCIEELNDFAGSKYVKSNPIGIYAKVIEKLKHSEKVLFIGLPCQVAAVKNSTAILPLEMRDNSVVCSKVCQCTRCVLRRSWH